MVYNKVVRLALALVLGRYIIFDVGISATIIITEWWCAYGRLRINIVVRYATQQILHWLWFIVIDIQHLNENWHSCLVQCLP